MSTDTAIAAAFAKQPVVSLIQPIDSFVSKYKGVEPKDIYYEIFNEYSQFNFCQRYIDVEPFVLLPFETELRSEARAMAASKEASKALRDGRQPPTTEKKITSFMRKNAEDNKRNKEYEQAK